MTESSPAEISVADLAEKAGQSEVQIIDVRTDEEWAEGRIAGSRHITLNDVSAAADSLDRTTPLIFVCSGGRRSKMAVDAYRTAGFDAYSLAGGLDAWVEEGNALESG